LQEANHIVGVTGTTINDAPALKVANVGIAVSGGTDAVRAAGDVTLSMTGIQTISNLVIDARKVLLRIKIHCIYSITLAIRIVITFTFLTIVYDWYFPILAVMLWLLNDLALLSINKANIAPNPVPQKWNWSEILIIAITFGVYLSVSTLVLFYLAKDTTIFQRVPHLKPLNNGGLRSLIYFQIAFSSLITSFASLQCWSWGTTITMLRQRTFLFTLVAAAMLGAYGLDGFPHTFSIDVRQSTDWTGIGWGYICLASIWSAVWYLLMDPIKVIIYRIVKKKQPAKLHVD